MVLLLLVLPLGCRPLTRRAGWDSDFDQQRSSRAACRAAAIGRLREAIDKYGIADIGQGSSQERWCAVQRRG